MSVNYKKLILFLSYCAAMRSYLLWVVLFLFYSLPLVFGYYLDVNNLIVLNVSDSLLAILQKDNLFLINVSSLFGLDRTLINNLLIYIYSITTSILFLGNLNIKLEGWRSFILKCFQRISLLIKGSMLCFSIKVSWAYHTGKLLLLNLFNQVVVERKLTSDEKIEIFNKISEEFKGKVNIKYDDIKLIIEHINDPHKVELIVKNYFYSVKNILAENSSTVVTSFDWTPILYVIGTIIIFGIIIIASSQSFKADAIKGLENAQAQQDNNIAIMGQLSNIDKNSVNIQKELNGRISSLQEVVAETSVDSKTYDLIMDGVIEIMEDNNKVILRHVYETLNAELAKQPTKEWLVDQLNAITQRHR